MNPEQESNFAQDTYQTGSTCPPKSHGGLIAFLLVLVIFLCGVSTALGLMNIRLFRSLNESNTRETSPVIFSHTPNSGETDDVCFPLGFCGQELPEIWCLYQDLPKGIYITDVDDGSDAAAKGVLPGDILMCLEGEAITTAAQLTSILEALQKSSAQVVLYRDGQQIELTLSVAN